MKFVSEIFKIILPPNTQRNCSMLSFKFTVKRMPRWKFRTIILDREQFLKTNSETAPSQLFAANFNFTKTLLLRWNIVSSSRSSCLASSLSISLRLSYTVFIFKKHDKERDTFVSEREIEKWRVGRKFPYWKIVR